MSVAAAPGGVMSGASGSGGDDDNFGGKNRKGFPKDPDFVLSSDEDSDDDQTEADGAGAAGKATRRSTLDCLDSLEASLPMKRGLSSHYHGKSKSFNNLMSAMSGFEDAKELGKKEHAVNKRRRLMIAHEHHEKTLAAGSKSNMNHPSSLPHFPSQDRNDDEEEVDDEDGNDDYINDNQPEDGK